MPDSVTLENVRKAIKNKGAKWIAGETSISRLAPEIRVGLLSSKPFGPVVPAKPLPMPLPSLPASFDWTNVNGKNYVTSVKDQIGGTCTTFASTAALESCVIRMGLGKIDIDLSEHTILSIPDGGDGNLHAIAAFMKATGLPPEEWFPGDLATARAEWQFETYKVKSWDCLYPTVVDEVKALIVQNGPIVTTMNYPEGFFHYKGGIYSNIGQPSLGFHAILVVGFDDHDKCFKAKNSWGKGWGDNGYCRIAYSEFKSAIVNFGWDIHTYPSAVGPHVAAGSYVTSYISQGYNGYSFGDIKNEVCRYQTFTINERRKLAFFRTKIRKVSGSNQSGACFALCSAPDYYMWPPLVTGEIYNASGTGEITTDFTEVYGKLNDIVLAPGRYALILYQKKPQAAHYEWAVGSQRSNMSFGKFQSQFQIYSPPKIPPGRIDESNLGCAWLQLFGQNYAGEIIDITHSSTQGNGFGDKVNEIRRFQTFMTSYDSKRIIGVDVRIRRFGGLNQSDLRLDLYPANGTLGTPLGAEPLATAFIPASQIGQGWTIVHADLHCNGLYQFTRYAIVLSQRASQESHYEWAVQRVCDGLPFGKWNGTSWIPENGLGNGWMKIWGESDYISMISGVHNYLNGYGFGNQKDEVKRYQIVNASQFQNCAVSGIDLKLRKVFGSSQSDLTVDLYKVINDQPAGNFATVTIPSWSIDSNWSIVHIPLWCDSLPTDKIAIVVGQAAPQTSRYEWAAGGQYNGKFGKWTGSGFIDESNLGSAWFNLYAEYQPAKIEDLSNNGNKWYGFGNVTNEKKRFVTYSVDKKGTKVGIIPSSMIGIELKLRKNFGDNQSDVIVQIFNTLNGLPTNEPISPEVIIPSAEIDKVGRILRVMLPCLLPWDNTWNNKNIAIVLSQRTPKEARYEWVTGANSRVLNFGKGDDAGWVDELSALGGAGWVRVWWRQATEPT